MNSNRQFFLRLGAHYDSHKRWSIIRDYYASAEAEILSGRRFSPYHLGLERYLTPIEVAIWNEIRCYGLPFFMQYPVGRRFVDFGDPVKKIAIEADGKDFHSEEKDSQKNCELNEAGWRVFRISGKDCFSSEPLADVLPYYDRAPIRSNW